MLLSFILLPLCHLGIQNIWSSLKFQAFSKGKGIRIQTDETNSNLDQEEGNQEASLKQLLVWAKKHFPDTSDAVTG